MSHHLDESSLVTPTSSAFAVGPADTLLSLSRGDNGSDTPAHKASAIHRSATPPLLRTPAGQAFATHVRQWGRSEIAAFLNMYKCEQYITLFHQNDIDGKVLLDLDMSSLKEIGINKIGDRVKLLGGVRDLRKRAAQATPPSTSLAPRVLPITVYPADGSPLPPLDSEPRGSQVQKRLAATALVSKRLQSSRPPPLNLHRPNPVPSVDGPGGSPTSRSVTPKSLQLQSQPKSLHLPPASDTVMVKSSSHETSSLRPPPSRDLRRSPSPVNDYTSSQSARSSHLTDENMWRAPPRPDVPLPVKVVDRRQGGNRHPDPKMTSPSQHAGLRDTASNPTHPFAVTLGRKDPLRSDSLRRGPPRSTSAQGTHGAVMASNSAEVTRPGQPTLEHLLRQVIKFVNSEDGTTKTVNVSSCTSGVEVLETVLRKFGKWNTGSLTNLNGDVDGDNDRLEVDGWGVYVKGEHGEEGMSSLPERLLITRPSPIRICSS